MAKAVLKLALIMLIPVAAAAAQSYEPVTEGTRILEGNGGFQIKMLVESMNLGGAEVEIGEITFPPGSGSNGGGHRHQVIEIFYVLSGELHHVVNDEVHVVRPGMVGIVRPEDTVAHRVPGSEPVRALVIWAPGGEADRLARFFTERPVDG